MIKTTAFIGLGLCVLLLSGCAPKIDGSSAKAYEDSLVKVTSGLDNEKKATFSAAVDVLLLRAPRSEELGWEANKRATLSGKSAETIINEAKEYAIQDYLALKDKIAKSHRPPDSLVVSNVVLTNPKFGEVERVDYGRYKHAIDVDVENKNNFDIDGVCASLAGKDELSPVPLWKANVNFGGDNKSQGRIQAGSKRRVTLQLLMLKEDAYTFRSECNSCFFYNVDDYNLYSVWYGEQLKGLFRFYLDHKDNRRGLSVGITVNSVYTSDTHYSAVNGCSDGSFQLKRPVDKFLTVIKYKR